jgi:4-coumarate--CoA ligase (photoactive yellow protein activation family)
MTEIIDRSRLEVLVNEIFWYTLPACQDIPFKGHMVDHLGVDSLDALDLAAEFHFRFDMLSGNTESYLLQYKNAEDWFEQIYLAANDPKKRFGFFTSGTTGEPRQIYHQKSKLIEERDFWLDFTKAKGLICLVPVRHIYGFIWGLLLGSQLKKTTYLNTADWHKVLSYATNTDLIIGHPTAWQQIPPPFPHKFAISSTAAMPQALQKRLSGQGIKGFNVYGSTETAAIGWQNWETDYFELLPYWQPKEALLWREEEVYEIPDHVIWKQDRQFEIRGRKDALIEIAGENVSLNYVRTRLKLIPGVADVWVKPYKGPWGIRLYSYFQLRPEQSLEQFEKELPDVLKSLPPSLKPRKWEIGYEAFNKFES